MNGQAGTVVSPGCAGHGPGVVGPAGGSAQGELALAACYLTVTSICLALCGWHSDPKITRHHCAQQKADNTGDGRCRTPRGIGSAIRARVAGPWA